MASLEWLEVGDGSLSDGRSLADLGVEIVTSDDAPQTSGLARSSAAWDSATDSWQPMEPREPQTLARRALLRVHGGFVHRSGLVSTSRGVALCGASVFAAAASWPQARARAEATWGARPAPLEIAPALVLVQPGDRVFGHWLLDLVPRVSTATRVGVTDHLLGHALPAFAHRLITALGAAGRGESPFTSHQLPDSAHEWFGPADLFVATGARQGLYLAPWIRGFQVAPSATSDHRVFLSRRNAQRRSRELLNEEEVEDIFAREGWTVVEPQELPLHEQLELVAGASWVAGVDGSALHLALQCRSGAGLLVLSSPRQFNQLHRAVAEAADLHYRLLQGHATDRSTGQAAIDFQSPFALPGSDLVRALRDL